MFNLQLKSNIQACARSVGATVTREPRVKPDARGRERRGDLRVTGIVRDELIIDTTVVNPAAYASRVATPTLLFASEIAAEGKRRHYRDALEPHEELSVANWEVTGAIGHSMQELLNTIAKKSSNNNYRSFQWYWMSRISVAITKASIHGITNCMRFHKPNIRLEPSIGGVQEHRRPEFRPPPQSHVARPPTIPTVRTAGPASVQNRITGPAAMRERTAGPASLMDRTAGPAEQPNGRHQPTREAPRLFGASMSMTYPLSPVRQLAGPADIAEFRSSPSGRRIQGTIVVPSVPRSLTGRTTKPTLASVAEEDVDDADWDYPLG